MAEGNGAVDIRAFSVLVHEIRLGILGTFFERWETLNPGSSTSREHRGCRIRSL